MNDKIDRTTQLYEQLMDKTQLANHKLLVKNIHLLDTPADDDGDDEEDRKFHGMFEILLIKECYFFI